MDFQTKLQLISLQREICNQIDQHLPLVSEFNEQSLLRLAKSYAIKLIQISKINQQDRQQFQRYIKILQEDLSNRSKMMLQLRNGLSKQHNNATFSSSIFSVDRISYKQENSENLLNWNEILQVLEQAFSQHTSQQSKGCQLLQTLDYKLNFKQSPTNNITFKVIYWLQQAHRFKDRQIKSIYQRLAGIQQQNPQNTFPYTVNLIHKQLNNMFESRNGYIRVIQELNNQITDCIAQNTKKQIQQSGNKIMFNKYEDSFRKINALKSCRSSEMGGINNSSNKRHFLQERQERRLAEKSIQEILNQFVNLKNQNEQLRNLLNQQQLKLKLCVQTNNSKQKVELDESSIQNKYCLNSGLVQPAMLQKIQRQFSKQINLLNILEGKIQKLLRIYNQNKIVSERIRYQIPEIQHIEDIPQHLADLNKELQDIISRLQISINNLKKSEINSNDDDNFRSMITKLNELIDKMLSNQRQSEPFSIQLIEKLYIQIRKMENIGVQNIKKKDVGSQIMKTVVRIQKQLTKYNNGNIEIPLLRILQEERQNLILLVGQIFENTKASQSKNLIHQKQNNIRQQLTKQFEQQKAKLTQHINSLELQINELKRNKQDSINVICQASKRINNLERQLKQNIKDKEQLKRQKRQLSKQNQKMKSMIKQQKENSKFILQKNQNIKNNQTQIYFLTVQNKQLEQQLYHQRQSFLKQRNHLVQQVHKTGEKLQQIQKLAEKKIEAIHNQLKREKINSTKINNNGSIHKPKKILY